MQFVKTADLKPGMRLAKPIYNKMGVLLYERDTLLTMQGINSIENFGLIGIFILEPAEPVPPLSREDLEFEQFQTIYVFKLKFAQNLRSSADFVYKHSISVGILCAMITNQMHLPAAEQTALITAALLYDFGYLYVPQTVLDKGDDLTTADKDFIQLNLERGYETLRPDRGDYKFPVHTLDIIQQIIFKNSRTLKVKEPADNIRLLVDILAVADEFDHLTAMNINKPPISEIAAMGRLKKDKATYNPLVLSALAECIHILPTGACVDLSDGEKALVLAENPADFLHPMVLKFSTNMIYDLSDPVINKSLKITDIMKTMDNRIALDKDSVKHFVSDAYIKETADRFRKVKLQIAQHNQSKLEQKAASALMSSASVIPQDALGTEKPLTQKKPRKKMKLR